MFVIAEWLPRVYDLNEKWWRDIKTNEPKERNEGELFCLMASELSEAMEGDRKKLADDKLPQFPMVGVEMVDFVIRVMDYCSRRHIPLLEYEPLPFWWPENENRASIIWGMHRRLTTCFASSLEGKSEQFSTLIQEARTFCLCFNMPFEDMFEAKFDYNVGRADHKHEARAAVNGKEY